MKFINLTILLLCFGVGSAHGVGNYPVPQINDVSLDARVEYDSGTGRFLYSYDVTSGIGNQGGITSVFIDIKRSGFRPGNPPSDFNFSIPRGTKPASEELNSAQDFLNLPYNTTIEVLGTELPEFWFSGVSGDGYLVIQPPLGGLDQNDQEISVDLISPGDSISNLIVHAVSAPTLREVIIEPDWRLVVANEAEAETIRDQAYQFASNLLIEMTTIGPESINFFGTELDNRLGKDIDRMGQLGWITNSSLVGDIQNLLSDAKVFLLNNDGTQAKVKYQQAIDLMASVTEFDMRREAIDLINVNLQLKLDFTPDTFIPPDLVLIVEPKDSELKIGETVVFTTKVIDRARDDLVVSTSRDYRLEVLSGPHEGLVTFDEGSGLGYIGTKVGTDIVEITELVEEEFALNGDISGLLLANLDDPDTKNTVKAQVTWTGGPDYVISFFSPPFLDYEGDETIFVHEATKNIGTTDGLDSTTTQYFLSSDPIIDVNTAFQLQERVIDPLLVGVENASGTIEVVWPTDFPPGRYYFAACVDAKSQITELDENNNCSFHQVARAPYRVAVLTMEETEVMNMPPICEAAYASKDKLWPPNGKFSKVKIKGVQDPENDDVLITVTSITQDEHVNSKTLKKRRKSSRHDDDSWKHWAHGSSENDDDSWEHSYNSWDYSGDSSDNHYKSWKKHGNSSKKRRWLWKRTSPDGKGVGKSFARLRAERNGKGDGRVYAIHFKAVDTAGNECTGVVNVGVPHSKGKKGGPAVDSGQVFDSTIKFH